ncbi:hypothetical protein [Nocardia wallacei]|uniref:hypothetical protein n=1 Tax=Nocardia wallacei TaxID=480035 RepID=UPI002455927D|nr:hypothetical protein [Nocardia wallacei]
MNDTPTDADRVDAITARAERAGYHLEHTPGYSHEWQLLDAEDGTPLYSSTTLTRIEQWLDE